MAVSTITSTSASPQTWSVPTRLAAGDRLLVEAWGAASGGSRGTSNGAGGAGAAFASSPYTITPGDITATTITFTLQAGTAGVGATNSTVGPDTTWSASNINGVPNSINMGATPGVIGSGGTWPNGWSAANGNGTTLTLSNIGTNANGYQSFDLRIQATSTVDTNVQIFWANTAPATAAAYTRSFYASVVGGAQTNITEFAVLVNTQNSGAFVAQYGSAFTITGTWTQFTGTDTYVGTLNQALCFFQISFNAGVALDCTYRIGGVQHEAGASATAWKSTPGYVRAKGGGPTSGTTGGTGGQASACIPTNGQYTGAVAFNGGNGATNAQGGGGGGSAGPDGIGGNSSSTTGGTGDAGNVTGSGTSDVRGASGGLGATGTGRTAGGDPGGGGGGRTTGTSGTGAAGGRGQIRLTTYSMLGSQTGAAAGISGDATVQSGARAWTSSAKVDAAAGVSSYGAVTWASNSATALGATSISSYASRWWSNTAGELDATGGGYYSGGFSSGFSIGFESTGFIPSGLEGWLSVNACGGATTSAATADIQTRAFSRQAASGEVDAAGSTSSRAFLREALIGQTDAAASANSAVPILWARAAGEIDSAGSIPGDGRRLTYALGQIDAAASINAAANLWEVLSGELDGAAAVSGDATPRTTLNLVAGRIDGAADIEASQAVLAALASQVDAIGSGAARAGFWAAAGGLLGGQAAYDASPAVWVIAASQADAAGSVSAAVFLRAPLAGEADAAGSVASAANAQLGYAASLDATGSIGMGAIIARLVLVGEIDGEAYFSARAAGATRWFASGELAASGDTLGAGTLWAEVRGQIDGAAGASAAAALWANSSSFLIGIGSFDANPLRVTYAGAGLDAAGSLSSAAALLGALAGRTDAESAFLPGSFVLLAGATGAIEAAGLIDATGTLFIPIGAQLDAGGDLFALFGHEFYLGAHLDAYGGFFAGWQQFVELGVRLPPKDRGASETHPEGARLLPEARGAAIGRAARGVRLPPRTRGRAA